MAAYSSVFRSVRALESGYTCTRRILRKTQTKLKNRDYYLVRSVLGGETTVCKAVVACLFEDVAPRSTDGGRVKFKDTHRVLNDRCAVPSEDDELPRAKDFSQSFVLFFDLSLRRLDEKYKRRAAVAFRTTRQLRRTRRETLAIVFFRLGLYIAS